MKPSISGIFLLAAMLLGMSMQKASAQITPVSPLLKSASLPSAPVDSSMLSLSAKDSLPAQPSTRNYIPFNFYSTHLGAACKLELQLEKQTKLPIRIRLGSKDQVDYLEGKYNRH